jgi:uncharacterized phosphatase
VTRLLLIRHAESVWNAQKRWQGRADPPLSDVGRTEAARASDVLRGAIDTVFASPQIRARDTARIIADALDLGEVRTEHDLCEVDVGVFSGLTSDEVEARYPDELAAWRAGDLDTVAPGGESRRALIDRVFPALERVAKRSDAKRVLVVTHGGVIGAVERHLDCWELFNRSTHLSGRWLTYDGGFRPDAERTWLIDDAHEPSPEAR